MMEIGRAALWYAQHLGWAVFPCHTPKAGRCSCNDANCRNVGKHPRLQRGLLDASKDPAKIADWWAMWPEANIGIVSGELSGFIAIDVDPRHGGDDSLADLEHKHGKLPHTVEALTGGGGRHLLFRFPGGDPRNRANIRPGIDARCNGGYILAARSMHASGRAYEWEVDHRPDKTPLVDAPPWLLDLVVERKNGAKPPVEWRAILNCRVGEGGRNDTATRIAGKLIHHGIDGVFALDLVQSWNEARCNPPLAFDEIQTIVASVIRTHARKESSRG